MKQTATLKQVRAEWEKGLTPLSVINQDDDTVLVILEKNGKYHCHRYFTMSIQTFNRGTLKSWTCSVDGREIPLNMVFSWLNNPCAYYATHDWNKGTTAKENQ